MNRRQLILGFGALPVAACSGRTLVPSKRAATRVTDLTPHVQLTRTRQFPARRPNGTLPPLHHVKDMLCSITGCPSPSPPPGANDYTFDYDSDVVCDTYGSDSYAELYRSGVLGHQTYFGAINSDGSLPIQCVGATQTASATLVPAAQIPIDADFIVGNLTGHVYSSSESGHIWDSAGNITYVAVQSTTTLSMSPAGSHGNKSSSKFKTG
jgi:hypothetical protein